MADLEIILEKYPILCQLHEKSLEFSLFEHEPIFTVEQGNELSLDFPGQGTKNLFVCDKKKLNYFLVTLCEEKRVDLKKLGEILEAGRLSFGSAEKLFEYLNITPGSVTPLCMLVGKKDKVKFFIDKELLNFDLIQVHPLINSATIVVEPKKLFLDLFKENGIQTNPINIPTIQEA